MEKNTNAYTYLFKPFNKNLSVIWTKLLNVHTNHRKYENDRSKFGPENGMH